MGAFRYLPAVLCLAVLGCGNGGDRQRVFPVSGRLTYHGKPMKKALVSFHPLNDPGPRAVRASAEADAQGNYRLTTYISTDGAAAGEYGVTIYWPSAPANLKKNEEPEQLPPDQLRGAYSNRATTRLRATVLEQDNVIDFKLPEKGARAP